MLRRLTANGAHGWWAVAGLVTAWDVVAVVAGGESMSTAFRRAAAAPGRRWKVTVVVVYLAAHLYAPSSVRRADPLCVAAGWLERGCGRAPASLHPG